MHLQRRFVCVLIPILCLVGHLSAATAASTEKDQTDINAVLQKAFTNAVRLREDTASAVATQTEKAGAAIVRLKAHGSLSGLPMTPDADFAFGIVDVGQRLLSMGKTTEAAVFFLAAEKTLDALATNSAEADSQNKALLLQQLGFIRGHYLNEAAQAKKDFEEAIRLQPDDKSLQHSRDVFLDEHAELVTGQTELQGIKP